MANNYQKEQVHKIQATEQEMDAWEALRREPGLMGRLARRGKHMKRDYVGGKRAYFTAKYGGTGTDDGSLRGSTPSPGPSGPSGPSSSNDGGYSGPSKAQLEAQRRAAEEKAKKAAEEKAKKDKLEKEEEDRKVRRGELTDEFGGYKDDFKGLRGEADYTDQRGKLTGYQADADTLRKDAGTKFGGYESQIGQMADRGTQVGQLGDEALDTQKLMKDRGLFAGQIEAQRKAAEGGKMANLRRSMAAAGSSPEEIARAEAEQSDQGQGAREDAIAASMGAMQARQGQLGQAASLYGQGQSLGLQKTGAQAGMYQQGLGAQQNLMATGAGLVGQEAGLQAQGISQRAGLTGQMAGMTRDQLQDVVAQQNAAQEMQLAERGIHAQQQANAAGAPQGPSQGQQLMQLAQAAAPIAMMAMSDKKAKKNIKSAKDKDLMEPKEIDGFLNNLYAYQYNYKNSDNGVGKQVGVMAQDLEKTQLGKQMVEKTPQGKQINAAKGLGIAMASQARLNQRLNSIGA